MLVYIHPLFQRCHIFSAVAVVVVAGIPAAVAAAAAAAAAAVAVALFFLPLFLRSYGNPKGRKKCINQEE